MNPLKRIDYLDKEIAAIEAKIGRLTGKARHNLIVQRRQATREILQLEKALVSHQLIA